MKSTAVDTGLKMAHNARTPETTGVEIGVSDTTCEKSQKTQGIAIFSHLNSSSMAACVEGRKTRRSASGADTPIYSSRRPHWRECGGKSNLPLGVTHV